MNPRGATQLLRDDDLAEEAIGYEPIAVAVAAPAGLSSVSDEALPLRRGRTMPAEVWSTESLHRRLLAVADVAGVAFLPALVLSRFGTTAGAMVAIATIPLVLLIFKLGGLYNRDELSLAYSTLDEVPLLFQLTGICALGAVTVQAMLASGSVSGGRAATIWGASFTVVLVGRVLARTIARRIVPAERCLLVGDPERAELVGQRIAASRANAVVVDHLYLRDEDIAGHRGQQIIRRLVRDLRLHRIIICAFSSPADGTADLIRTAKATGVRVSVLPPALEAVGGGAAFDVVEGMPMLGVPRFALCRSSRLLKRTFDTLMVAIGLVVVCPVIAAIALAIKLDSKGSVFFRQVRIGRDGRPFVIFKFRTMLADAEARKEELRSLSVAGPGLFKIENDPRVTRVGKLLRSSSLDELPQLFNVMRGEMSLVGPRPLVTDEDAQVLGLDRSRLSLKPGMTGPWQLLETRVPLNEMVEIDYFYASSWSLWLDVKIILRTALHVLRRGNL